MIRQRWVLLVFVILEGGDVHEIPSCMGSFPNEEQCWSYRLPIGGQYLARCLALDEALARYPEIHWL